MTSTVNYVAAAGEQNTVTAHVTALLVDITDTTAPVTAGAGCMSTGIHSAQCMTSPLTTVLDLGDLADVGSVDGGVATILGGPGSDVLTGGIWGDTLLGDDGNDILNGGDSGDILYGGPGTDTLNGGAADDDLKGGSGADTLNGGTGEDVADYGQDVGPVTVNLAAGTGGPLGEVDTLTDIEDCEGSSWAGDVLIGNGSENVIHSGPGADTLDGAGDDDTLFGDGSAGGDSISGGPGNDNLWGTVDNDVLDGGDGNDNLRGAEGSDLLTGGAGTDDLEGGPGADVLNGGDGTDWADYVQRTNPVTVSDDGVANDGELGEHDNVGTDVEVLLGGSGDDTLIGNGQANELNGGNGDDDLDGGAGTDTLIGGGGNDDTADYSTRTSSVTIMLDGSATSGEAGENDTIETDVEDAIGGSGADTLIGSGGDNFLDGGPGADTFSGGGGFDAVVYATRTEPVTVTLDGVANDGEAGEGDNVGAGMEDAIGGSGNDSLTGNAESNLLAGGPGADVLSGAGGDDFLIGESGADSLTGGAGFDIFDGGSDNDVIQSRDTGVDGDISCGDGVDSVVADVSDITDADCEFVHRGAPLVVTGAASEIAQATATLSGTVNTNGQATSAYVELGTTTAYGSRSTTLALPASLAPFDITTKWSGLQPGTAYHYRVVATNLDGTTTGANRSFTTTGGVLTTADLTLSMTARPLAGTIGALITHTVTVTNGGAAAAAGVVVSDSLPSQLAFVSATASQGSCNVASPVRCDLGSMANGASATVTIVARATAAGTISNTATLSSTTTDPVGGNNSATATVSVQRPVTPVPKCVVPRVKGKTLAAARKAIVRGRCALGKVRSAYSAKVRRGRVISQRPAPGFRLRKGSKVNLTISRGARRAVRR